jgi:hypothetical protein
MFVTFCDIDSTVNDHYNRIERNTVNGVTSKKAWTREEMEKDQVLENAVYVNHLLTNNGAALFFLTARLGVKDHVDITESWLDKHGFRYNGILYCRRMIDKINIVKIAPPHLLIDDFMTCQERGKENMRFRIDIVEELKKYCEVAVFKGEWIQLCYQIRDTIRRVCTRGQNA